MPRADCFETHWFKIGWQACAFIAISLLAGIFVNSMRSESLPLLSSRLAGDVHPGAGQEIATISLDEAEALFFAQRALFLDARDEDFYNAGHIQGARNIPADQFEKFFPESKADLPQGMVIITYCDGEECGLSKMLAQALLENGYADVRVLSNGWTLWRQSNLPVEGTE